MNFGDHAGSTGGMKEGKGTSWQGGTRMPCIMRWPQMIDAGTITNKLTSTIDTTNSGKYYGAKLPKNKIDG